VPSEIRTLAGLRFVAIWGAVLGQLYFLHEGLIRHRLPAQAAGIAEWVESGQTCADVFFCLSGLVLTYRYGASMGSRLERSRLGSFAAARAARIWPVYLVCLMAVFAVLVVDNLTANQPQYDDLLTGNLVRQVLLIQDWYQSVPYESSWILSSWTLSAVVVGSIAFPFLILPVYRAAQAISSRGRLVIACAIPLPISVLVIDENGLLGDDLWLLRLFCFFTAGMLLATVITRPLVEGDTQHPLGLASDHRSWTWPLTGVLAVAVVAAVGLSVLSKLPPYAALLGGVVPLVGLVAVSHPFTQTLLANPPMVHGGRVAYSFSLAQAPIVIAIALAVPDRWAERHTPVYVAVLAAGVAIAWLAAELLWRLVEVPARVTLTAPLPTDAPVTGRHPSPSSTERGTRRADQG
jgi:peptidoglycan/LPS O-acetylase OafA/YrhL